MAGAFFSWRRAANNIVLGGGAKSKTIVIFAPCGSEIKHQRLGQLRPKSNVKCPTLQFGGRGVARSGEQELWTCFPKCGVAIILPSTVVFFVVIRASSKKAAPCKLQIGCLCFCYTSCDVFRCLLISLYILRHLTVLLKKKKPFLFPLKEP